VVGTGGQRTAGKTVRMSSSYIVDSMIFACVAQALIWRVESRGEGMELHTIRHELIACDMSSECYYLQE
jgi:hypothetical protein